MLKPGNTKEEAERLLELASFDVMDSEIEEDYERLTQLAAEICGTKVSLVSLIDANRQWFKSSFGLEAEETQREFSFCGHAILNPKETFIINDARKDERFSDNPFVTDEPNVVFYAGVPLVTEKGYPLGTLCVLDDQPRDLDERQLSALKTISIQVMKLLELRKKNKLLNELNEHLENRSGELEDFANRAAHDLKSPLRSIYNMVERITKNNTSSDQKTNTMLGIIEKSTKNLDDLVSGLLEFAKTTQMSIEEKSKIDPKELIEKLKSTTFPNTELSINLVSEVDTLNVNKDGLSFVLRNLITNAVKYCDKPEVLIDISIREINNSYKFSISDNGPGIDPKNKERMFIAFNTLTTQDRFGNKGSGLGLSSVKKVLERMGGSISFTSEMGQGTVFSFTVE
jgi:signal transduction histidine kinase